MHTCILENIVKDVRNKLVDFLGVQCKGKTFCFKTTLKIFTFIFRQKELYLIFENPTVRSCKTIFM